MVAWIRSKLAYANVMATVAVFLALGSGAYAAASLPQGSVGSKQIKRNAVNSAKVKNHSLLARDFRAGQLPRGERGPMGAAGPLGAQGPAGTAFAFAHVNGDGTLNASTSKGIASVTKSTGNLGEYCLTVTATPKVAIASGDGNQGGNVIAQPNLATGPDITTGACPQGTNAIVVVTTGNQTLIDHAFYVLFDK
jgi:hypothetical protein